MLSRRSLVALTSLGLVSRWGQRATPGGAPHAAEQQQAFVDALAAALAELPADHCLIITERTHLFFVQFAADERGLRAETVHDQYRAGLPHLSAAQRDALLGLGWGAPTQRGTPALGPDAWPGSSNWFRDWLAPAPLHAAAWLAADTLFGVHGARSAADLRYKAFDMDGAPLRLAPLDAMLPTPEAM